MKTEVKKDVLIKTIQENRGNHRAIFEKAIKAYQKKLEEILLDKLKRVRKGSKIQMYFSLPQPEDHTKDYDRILQMLNMEIKETIELEENEFSQFVMDDWAWKNEWVSNTLAYTNTIK